MSNKTKMVYNKPPGYKTSVRIDNEFQKINEWFNSFTVDERKALVKKHFGFSEIKPSKQAIEMMYFKEFNNMLKPTPYQKFINFFNLFNFWPFNSFK